jgi:4-amino-4-deoxy-L-arabinose transferase-like glycosyltransferase
MRFPSISKILIVAFFLRILLIYIGNNIFSLPDSGADAKKFEAYAWNYAKEGFLNVFNYYRGPDSSFISFFIAIFYSLFGRSFLLAQSFSLFFGMGSIFLGWIIAKKVWDDHTARKVGWFLALFPSFILYSVLILREVYAIFFLLIAILGIVNWYKKKDFLSLVTISLGFVAATFFHGGMIVGAIIFFVIVGIQTIKRTLKSLMNLHFHSKSFILTILILISLTYYVSGKISLPKLGTFHETIDLNRISELAKITTRSSNDSIDGASYPEWVKINSPTELFYKGPIRMLFFIFSPLPWHINKITQIVGLFDSILYMYLSFLIFKNRKQIWKDPTLKSIFIIFLSYIFVFGIVVGNFGTSIRHRVKFVYILILLAAPKIPKILIKKKKILNKHIKPKFI